MAKQAFSGISVKAAALTGAIVGFLCWLLVIPYSFSGYGMMSYSNYYGHMNYMMGNTFHNVTFGYMMNGTFHQYNWTGYYLMMDVYHSYNIYSIIIDMVLGTLTGFLIAVIYNWAIKL